MSECQVDPSDQALPSERVDHKNTQKVQKNSLRLLFRQTVQKIQMFDRHLFFQTFSRWPVGHPNTQKVPKTHQTVQNNVQVFDVDHFLETCPGGQWLGHQNRQKIQKNVFLSFNQTVQNTVHIVDVDLFLETFSRSPVGRHRPTSNKQTKKPVFINGQKTGQFVSIEAQRPSKEKEAYLCSLSRVKSRSIGTEVCFLTHLNKTLSTGRVLGFLRVMHGQFFRR